MMTRPISPELNAILGTPKPVLDHGFLTVVDYMGNDQSITAAARISYQTGTKKVNTDAGLINYLMSHKHTTPFEMCELKIHVKAPLFVMRQWVRHRTASINEMSGRYSVLDKEFYIPEPEVIKPQSLSNKQGRDGTYTVEETQIIKDILYASASASYVTYEELLSKNLSRELARTILPVNIYTQWVWKTNLHNLLHFINLRNDPHAQYEIRVYAEVLYNIVKSWVPLASDAFDTYIKSAIAFSGKEIEILHKIFRDIDVDKIKFPNIEKLSQREQTDFINKVKLISYYKLQ